MNSIRRFAIGLFLMGMAMSTLNIFAQDQDKFTEQDRLRGSITPERDWWDLRHYHLSVRVFPESKSLKGANVITFMAKKAGQFMQIDLQEPLEITKVGFDERELTFKRNGNVYLIDFGGTVAAGTKGKLRIEYGGVPTESENPPWSGGLTWAEDSEGFPLIVTTCQGIGASIWWPCKDHGYDEPDEGVDISVTVPDTLTAVANGRLVKTTENTGEKTKTFDWKVTYPINNYCVNINVGNYVNFSEKYKGKFGELDMDYWVLKHQKDRAMVQFKEAPRTIAAFEHWFGKYPFYRDSYKLVEVPLPWHGTPKFSDLRQWLCKRLSRPRFE